MNEPVCSDPIHQFLADCADLIHQVMRNSTFCKPPGLPYFPLPECRPSAYDDRDLFFESFCPRLAENRTWRRLRVSNNNVPVAKRWCRSATRVLWVERSI